MASVTFGFQGVLVAWTVPAGVYSATCECWAAQGQDYTSMYHEGGRGGYTKGTRAVTPGDVKWVSVGQDGNDGASGGFGGGGHGGDASFGGGTGGGASDVRDSTTLASRFIVAGGGGGSGADPRINGGPGGGLSGVKGDSTGGGQPGTQSSGYALGQGGPGSGGRGGGGYWGGYAGSNANSGGGGGSGFVGSLTNTTMTSGVRSGHGQVVITWPDNTPPYQPALTTPATNSYLVPTQSNTLGWTFQDPQVGDTQSRADLRWKQQPGDAWTTITNAASTAGTYALAANTWVTGRVVEWQVATWDLVGLAGPWSASSFVNTVVAVPAPTITAPTAGQALTASTFAVEWTTAGFSQDAYQVVRCANADGSGQVYSDTGTVVSPLSSAVLPLDAVSGRTDYVRVRFRWSGLWSPYASVAVVIDYGPPHNPTLGLDQVVGLPEVVITIGNLPASAGFASTVSTDLWRDGLPIATGLPNNSTFTDLLVGAGLVDYQAVAYAASGSSATSVDDALPASGVVGDLIYGDGPPSGTYPPGTGYIDSLTGDLWENLP